MTQLLNPAFLLARLAYACSPLGWFCKLEGTDEDGVKQYSYHIRLKGVSPDAINHYVNTRRLTDQDYSEWNVYEDLYNGESVTFDLNVNNKVRFEKSKDQEYGTFVGSFKRTIKF